jgi:hypothetical protein
MAKKEKGHLASPALHRVPVVMPLEMSDYLDELGSEAKRGGGFKLAKTVLIRALIRAMQTVDEKVGLDLTNVTTEEELRDRLLDAYRRYRG